MSEDARTDSAAMLERIVSQDPASPLYLPLAERMREQGRLAEAIRLCESRSGRPGEGVGDHVVLGRCYLAAGQLEQARQRFEAALELDRENVSALKALAGIHSHAGDHAKAADLYRAVCRVDPGDLESQTALHQITSGEFPEVRPPDLIVGQGGLSWQPVAPPREEENLAELSLGLQTIESFDPVAPRQATHLDRVSDFQELPVERLEIARPEPEPPPPDEPPPPIERPRAGAAPTASASPGAAERPSRPAGYRGPEGNRSAFEEWLRRLGSGGQG